MLLSIVDGDIYVEHFLRGCGVLTRESCRGDTLLLF